MKKIVNKFELKYLKIAPDVWAALAGIPREGWVRRKVKNPESDKEHIISCRNLVISLIDVLTEFSSTGIEDILDELEVHDWPEKITGDEVIVTYDQEEKKRLKAEKFKREHAAMLTICADLGFMGKRILDLWLRFERRKDKFSIFAYQIDKYQSIEKALEYQLAGENVSTQDFIDYYRNDITHPLLRQMMLNIELSLTVKREPPSSIEYVLFEAKKAAFEKMYVPENILQKYNFIFDEKNKEAIIEEK